MSILFALLIISNLLDGSPNSVGYSGLRFGRADRIVSAGKADHATPVMQKTATSHRAEDTPLSLCDLTSNPERFDGITVKVKTSLLGWRAGTALYDLRCDDDTEKDVGFELECAIDEICDGLRREMKAKTAIDSTLEWSRVRVVIEGRFVVRRGPRGNNCKYVLYAQALSEVSRVPSDEPWPRPTPVGTRTAN